MENDDCLWFFMMFRLNGEDGHPGKTPYPVFRTSCSLQMQENKEALRTELNRFPAVTRNRCQHGPIVISTGGKYDDQKVFQWLNTYWQR
jgi:hypothetical protein